MRRMTDEEYEEYEEFRERESAYEYRIECLTEEEPEQTETELYFGSERAFWKWKEG